MTTIKYLSLSKGERILVDIGNFFKKIGKGFINFFKKIPSAILKLLSTILHPFTVLIEAFKKGSWGVRANFLVFGFYQFTHHQIARGVLYLLYEVVFIWYLIVMGIPNLAKLGTLGSLSPRSVYLTSYGVSSPQIGAGDDSFKILLYSIVTIILALIFVVLWFYSIRDAKSLHDNISIGRTPKDIQFFYDLVDSKYHTLLLAVPMVGLVAFTAIPVLFMIITGFTNYNGGNRYILFDWVSFQNYSNLFSGSADAAGGESVVSLFLKVLAWTLLWALIATFTNYFLGMVVALMINKKGIKLKKLWRTVLIFTIAVPQFVSLLLIQRMLDKDGFVALIFEQWGWIAPQTSPFDYVFLSRALIIIVNMWVGVPYTMLICSGILMNIPEDLYESARIDGASPFKMYTAITLPYMLFVTGPYLLSQFIGNINNFNIIYLLSGGRPKFTLSAAIEDKYGKVGETDLLITWIYKMSMDQSGNNKNYAVACALGVLVFVVIAVFSLIFYGNSNAVKNEEDFQ